MQPSHLTVRRFIRSLGDVERDAPEIFRWAKSFRSDDHASFAWEAIPGAWLMWVLSRLHALGALRAKHLSAALRAKHGKWVMAEISVGRAALARIRAKLTESEANAASKALAASERWCRGEADTDEVFLAVASYEAEMFSHDFPAANSAAGGES